MRYFTLEQVAEQLQRHQETVLEMLALGQLPSVRLPWNGLVIPAVVLPPFSRVSEEEG